MCAVYVYTVYGLACSLGCVWVFLFLQHKMKAVSMMKVKSTPITNPIIHPIPNPAEVIPFDLLLHFELVGGMMVVGLEMVGVVKSVLERCVWNDLVGFMSGAGMAIVVPDDELIVLVALTVLMLIVTMILPSEDAVVVSGRLAVDGLFTVEVEIRLVVAVKSTLRLAVVVVMLSVAAVAVDMTISTVAGGARSPSSESVPDPIPDPPSVVPGR